MNVDEMNFPPETERLRFVVKRDGLSGAIAFAEQTKKIYREGVINKHKKKGLTFMSDRVFRRQFITSYLAFKRFLEKYGDGSAKIFTIRHNSD